MGTVRISRSNLRFAFVAALAWAAAAFALGAGATSYKQPSFHETPVFSGLVNPTSIRFLPDGSILVIEKSGLIKKFDSLTDPTPTVVADLRVKVHNFWDRGLLGIAIDPNFTTNNLLYVLYSLNAPIGGTPPKWTSADPTSDPCPTPPGATNDGCVIGSRLSRLTATGADWATTEQVLIEDWCQQFPSHSAGSLQFGTDGKLYVSHGEGASFSNLDWGQFGGTQGVPPLIPKNPCGDPPVPVGGDQTPPTAEGGSLRSQSPRRTAGEPRVLNGSILRIDPATGAGVPGNPFFGSSDANERRILGFGLRNPFRMILKPGTNDVWIADVGGGAYEEIDRIPANSGGGAVTFDSSGTARIIGSTSPITFSVATIAPDYVVVGVTYDTSTQVTSVTWNGANLSRLGGPIQRPGLTQWCELWGMAAPASGTHNIVVTHTQTGHANIYASAGAVFFKGADQSNPVGTFASATGASGLTASVDVPAAVGDMVVDVLGGSQQVTTAGPGQTARWYWDSGEPGFGSTEPAAASTVTMSWSWPSFGASWAMGAIAVKATPARNFGWPCYEGPSAYFTGFNICPPQAQTVAPFLTYAHTASVVPGDGCPTGTSSIAGMAFYQGNGTYPSSYNGAFFFSDYSRLCMWVMFPGTNGDPDPATKIAFASNAQGPVDLQIGPDGNVYYVDFDGGKIWRIDFGPSAVASANPTQGPVPLTVQFSSAGSAPAVPGDTITFAWDLDGDGAYDDSTAANPSWTYTTSQNVTARLKVTDNHGTTALSNPVAITAGDTPPTATILTPAPTLTWKVGDTISFSGTATDPPNGTLPASALSWEVLIQHCPAGCHTHVYQTFTGVSSGSFPAPDHEYPSYLEIRLTATDSGGLTNTASVSIQPQTVNLTMQSLPSGLQLTAGTTGAATPFVKTVILGSLNTLVAPSPQGSFTFSSWSDGGAQSHTVTANASGTYTATFTNTGGLPAPWVDQDVGSPAIAGSASFASGVFTVKGAGTDIEGASDQFHYVYQPLSNDVTITARVATLQNTDPWAKGGVMIRESLLANSKFAMMVLTPGNGLAFQRRLTTGGNVVHTAGALVGAPYWVRLVRSGSTLSGYSSPNGVTWTLVGTASIPMATGVFVGLPLTSHNPAALNTSTFDNVSATSGPGNTPPTVSITAPPNGSVYTAPASITIDATAGDTDGTVSKVDFFQNGVLLGTDTTSPYSFAWTNVAANSYSLTAVATDNGNATTTSAAVNVVVNTAGGGLPAPWVDQDVGSPAIAGSASFASGVFTVKGAGVDIEGTSDQFHYVYQPLSNDVTITARVATIQNTNPWAKGGVMIRESLNANSKFAMMVLTPGNGLAFQRRLTTGGSTSHTPGALVGAPYWVRLVRSGNTLAGYSSPNGTNWTLVGSDNISMAASVFVGLPLTSHNAGALNTSTFDNVSATSGPANTPPTVSITAPPNGSVYTAPASITIDATAGDTDGTVSKVDFFQNGVLLGTDTTSPYSFAWTNVAAGNYSLTAVATDNGNATTTSAPVNVVVNSAGGGLPAPWVDQDVGSPAIAGSASFASGVFTVKGAGVDIEGTSDQFHYVYQPLSNDVTITARVASIQNTDPWAKGGVMIRETLNANSKFAMMVLTPGNGLAFQRRLTTGGNVVHTPGALVAAPYWVRLVRSGSTLSGYTSPNGVTWTLVGSASIPMAAGVFVGLPLTSHNPAALNTSTFDNVSVTTP